MVTKVEVIYVILTLVSCVIHQLWQERHENCLGRALAQCGYLVWAVCTLILFLSCAPAQAERDYPTLTPAPVLSTPPAPGYARATLTWIPTSIDSISYSRYRTPQIIKHRLCDVPGGSVTVDHPASPPRVVLLFLGVPQKCEDAAALAVHWRVDRWIESKGCWAYVGAEYYAPGRPQVLALYPSVGERVRVWKSSPYPAKEIVADMEQCKP